MFGHGAEYYWVMDVFKDKLHINEPCRTYTDFFLFFLLVFFLYLLKSAYENFDWRILNLTLEILPNYISFFSQAYPQKKIKYDRSKYRHRKRKQKIDHLGMHA